jgi:hypothetical protein
MALEPTVLLIHWKILSGSLPSEGTVPIPDFLGQMYATAQGVHVDKSNDDLQCVYNLSEKLAEIRDTVPSTPAGTGWVPSPYTVISKATDQVDGSEADYSYTYQFEGDEVEVEYSVSLGFAA